VGIGLMEKGICHRADVAVYKEGCTGGGRQWNFQGFEIETFLQMKIASFCF